MAEPLHGQLLAQARRLARLDPRRPRQANVRRAVSSAYYALFHCLVDRACRSFIGTAHDRRGFRDVLARAFEHGTMARACRSFAGGNLPASIAGRLAVGFSVSGDLRLVAESLLVLQDNRHLADYDPAMRFTRAQVLRLIRDAEKAVALFARIRAEPETRFFLACLLTWNDLTARR